MAVAALALAGAACADDTPGTPEDPTLAAGQEVYGARCASCHGPSGGGGAAPALTGSEERFADIDEQIQIVRDGVEGTNMPSFGDILDDDEIESVVRYVRESL